MATLCFDNAIQCQCPERVGVHLHAHRLTPTCAKVTFSLHRINLFPLRSRAAKVKGSGFRGQAPLPFSPPRPAICSSRGHESGPKLLALPQWGQTGRFRANGCCFFTTQPGNPLTISSFCDVLTETSFSDAQLDGRLSTGVLLCCRCSSVLQRHVPGRGPVFLLLLYYSRA